MMAKVEVITTRGGQRALLDHRVGEVMHPVVGPLLEPEQLFLSPGQLQQRLLQPDLGSCLVLDIGLGAGSNAAAAFKLALSLAERARPLRVISFERDLAAFQLAIEPDNAAAFGLDGPILEAAQSLLSSGRAELKQHSWELAQAELPGGLDALAEPCADLVLWDPFSPKANPELWNVAAFTAVRRVCRRGASLHTYSGATAVRSALLLAGFFVGFGEPTGKGMSTAAAVELEQLSRPLDSRWLERLGRSSAAFPPDAPLDALEQVSRLPQFAS